MTSVYRCVILIVISIFLSCKNDKKTNDINNPIPSKKTKQSEPKNLETFSLRIKAIYPKDDIVTLFYIQNEDETHDVDQMISKKIEGSKDIQEIELKLPKKDYPFNLRIDFSAYETQEVIKVYECVLKYQNDSYSIEGRKLKDYFNFNAGIEILEDSLSFRLKHFKQNEVLIFDPYIIGNSKLEETLMTKI